MQKKRSVLVGSSGTGNAFSSIVSLRKNWGSSVKIISMDINPDYLVTSSLLADKHCQVSETLNPGFEKEVIKILSDENIDTYLPFIDEEIYLAAKLFKEKKLNPDLCLQIKSPEIAALCNDKLETFKWLKEQSILTPESYLTDSILKSYEKLILKPRQGFGTKVIGISEIRDNLHRYDPGAYILQDECELPELTIDVCFDRSRDYFQYLCRERIEVKSGVCTKARLFYDEKIEKIAFTLADKLNLHSFCFQVMSYKKDWAVTDINTRLGAGTGMSVAVGMDFFSAMFAILWGEDPSVHFTPLQKETFVTRHYCDYIMKN